MSAVAVKPMTVEEFEALGPDIDDFEMIDGELIEVEGMGLRHGIVTGDLHAYLGLFVRRGNLGYVLSSDTKYLLDPGPPLAIAGPDIAFIREDRMPVGALPEGVSRIVPDLVVETVSPSNRGPDLRRKIDLYLAAGVRLIWLLRPEQRTITVVRPNATDVVLHERDVLDGGEVLPGFRLPVADVFRR